MKALICKSPGTFEYAALPDPQVKPGALLLSIEQFGICGTDFHAYQGNQPYFNYPRILGHELCARIAEPNKNFNSDELVTVIPYLHCGSCQACMAGKTNCCTQLSVMGVHQDGGMCNYISVNSDYIIRGNGLDADELTIVEPLSIGAHAVSRADIRPNDQILVVGAGPIGIGTIFFAKRKGARVIVLDPIQSRLDFCAANFDLEDAIHGTTVDALEKLMSRFKNKLPSVIFEATGNLSAIEGSLPLLVHGGTIILVGLQKQHFNFSHPEFHKKETTLMSSRNATKADFELVMDTLRADTFPTNKYITHRCSFNNLKETFNTWINHREDIIKAVVKIN
jgi:2-desacetyl-2-hydroxyethyl bacteriochlorophyllide A dehydrogenase